MGLLSAAAASEQKIMIVRPCPASSSTLGDALELNLFREAVLRDTPVLDVCRGAQMPNVSLGGSLHRDIRARFPRLLKMWTPLPRKRALVKEPNS